MKKGTARRPCPFIPCLPMLLVGAATAFFTRDIVASFATALVGGDHVDVEVFVHAEVILTAVFAFDVLGLKDP